MLKKQRYVVPTTEVLEVMVEESVLQVTSPGAPGTPNGGYEDNPLDDLGD